MDWAKIIAERARTNSVFHSDELAREFSAPLQSLRVALRRQQKRGLVERITRHIYVNKLAAGFNARELATEICPEAYVSLDAALNEWGISSQSPVVLTCVSPRQIPEVKKPSAHILFRVLKKSLFWGFVAKKTRYGRYWIAEPEKALLDWVYFRRKDGFPLDFEEFELKQVSRAKLLEYARRYPATVQQALYPALIEQCFAA